MAVGSGARSGWCLSGQKGGSSGLRVGFLGRGTVGRDPGVARDRLTGDHPFVQAARSACEHRAVARPTATTLFQALLGTSVDEDALSDGLGYLISSNPEVARAFAALAGLHGVEVCTRAQTQVGVSGGRVDLEVVLTGSGRSSLLLVEVKTLTAEHNDQLTTYSRALRGRQKATGAADAQVVTLAPIGNPIEEKARELKLKNISWQQMLTSLVLIGEREGPGWREQAESRDAPVYLRDLLDYCWVLRKRGVAVDVDPLQPCDDLVAQRAETLLNPHGVLGALLDTAAKLDGYLIDQTYAYPRGQLAVVVGRVLTVPTHDVKRMSWCLAADGLVKVTVQLWFSTSDAQRCTSPTSPEATPGFLVGVVIEGSDDQPISSGVMKALDDPSWRKQLPSGVHVGVPEYDNELWIVGTKPLSELTAESRLTAQMELLRKWVGSALAEVLSVDRPPLWPCG